MSFRKFRYIAGASVAATSLAAQQPTPPDSAVDTLRRSVQLRAVTITAAPTDRAAPSNATHVSQSQIQQTPAADPWDLLRQTAGVEVHLAGQGPGFASNAAVRGFSSDHSTDLALWIDGVPINEPVNGHSEGSGDWSLIFPATVQSMDVTRGPTSALFGNFALSGVVNVRTLERTNGTQAYLSGGSFGRAEGSIVTGFDDGARAGGVFGFRARRESGFRPNSSNDIGQMHGRLVRALASNAMIDGGIELYGGRWNSPGYLSEQQFADRLYTIVSNPTDGGFKRRAQERLSLRITRGENMLWRTTLYATQARWQLFLTIPPQGGRFEGTGSQTEEEDNRYGYGVTSALTWSTSTVDFTVGGEGRFDRARYENWLTTDRRRDSVAAFVGGRQLSGALFVQSAVDLGKYVRVDVGGRYDVLGTTSIPMTRGTPTITGNHSVFSPKLGALVRMLPWLGLYANASKGFRSSDGVLEEPALAPITVWAYETGIKLDTSPVQASLDFFRMNVSNEQTFNPLTGASNNGGSSRRQGIEMDVRAVLTTIASLSSQWSFNDARYIRLIAQPEDPNEPPADVSGLRVYNTARYIGSAALDLATDDGVTAGKWNLRLGANWVGPYSPFDEPGEILGSYGLMHLSGRVRIARDAVLDLGIRNVFDRAYPELVAGHLVAPGEPRSAYLSLRFRL